MKQIFGFEGPVRFTPVAAEFPKHVTYDDLEAVAKRVGAMRNATPFWIGDILVKADAISDKYSQLSEIFDLKPDVLMNYKWVSANVPSHIRYEKLNWHYHYEIAKFTHKQQGHWLSLAVKKGWTLAEFKERLVENGLRKNKVRAANVVEGLNTACLSTQTGPDPISEIGACEACLNRGQHLKTVTIKICPSCVGMLDKRRDRERAKG